MKTLQWIGYGDDTLGESGVTKQCVTDSTGGRPLQCLITARGARLLVAATFAKSHIGRPCWVLGVSMADENSSVPNWPLRMKTARSGQSPLLEIDVPDDFSLTWYVDGKKAKAQAEARK